jgi:hypothetical protein
MTILNELTRRSIYHMEPMTQKRAAADPRGVLPPSSAALHPVLNRPRAIARQCSLRAFSRLWYRLLMLIVDRWHWLGPNGTIPTENPK